MNTNQSKRKKEFNSNADEKAFCAYIRRCAIDHKTSTQDIVSAIIGRIKKQDGKAITLGYTDNTAHFGEDYQAEKQL